MMRILLERHEVVILQLIRQTLRTLSKYQRALNWQERAGSCSVHWNHLTKVSLTTDSATLTFYYCCFSIVEAQFQQVEAFEIWLNLHPCCFFLSGFCKKLFSVVTFLNVMFLGFCFIPCVFACSLASFGRSFH